MNLDRRLNKKRERLSCFLIPPVIASMVLCHALNWPFEETKTSKTGSCSQGAPSLVGERSQLLRIRDQDSEPYGICDGGCGQGVGKK